MAGKLPAGMTLTKVDSVGRVLARQPDPARTVGQTAFDASVLARILGASNGAFSSPAGGAPLLYAFCRVTTPAMTEPIVAVLSVPEGVAFAEVTRALYVELAGLVLAAGLTLAFAWIVSERLVMLATKRLTDAARRLAAGDLTARTGLRHDAGEAGVLAHAFDEMAAALQRREAERAREETALRANEIKLSNALKLAHLGHWEYDVAADAFTFNDEFYAMMRTSAAAVGGYTMSSAEYAGRFLLPEEAHLLEQEIRASTATIDPEYGRAAEHRVIFGDGSQGWVAVRILIVKDSEHSTIKTFGANQDITARKVAEEALRASEERYRGLFENANDVVFSIDLSGRLTSLNRTGEAILGCVREEALGTEILGLVMPEQRKIVTELLERRRAGDTAAKMYECEIRTPDARRVPLEVNSRLLEADGRPVGVQGIARDVSERKRLQAQLAQAQKMEAVGRLAAGIAHDFNNLLTVIIGYCDLVESADLDACAREGLGQIKDAGVQAASLTRQLLAFSRRQVLEPKVLDLNGVVTNIAKLIERLVGEDVNLRCTPAPDLGRVKADPVQIEQVILNLAANARDAMVSGGALSIETANVDLDEAYAVAHPGAAAGHYVMLSVSDTGTGIDAETQARIFDPFFTTKEKGKGTGLGLATVYGVVKQSGGHIRVYSELGHGTTFKIYLPRVDAPAEAFETRPAAAAVVGGTETILLVEDDASLRTLARKFLEQGGYTVLEAPSGYAALESARLYSGRIQLLLTDVVLPGMNGPALADQLSRLVPGVKVLYVSGYTDDAITHHGVLEPGVNFLAKPYTQSGLARKVRELLDRA